MDMYIVHGTFYIHSRAQSSTSLMRSVSLGFLSRNFCALFYLIRVKKDGKDSYFTVS